MVGSPQAASGEWDNEAVEVTTEAHINEHQTVSQVMILYYCLYIPIFGFKNSFSLYLLLLNRSFQNAGLQESL